MKKYILVLAAFLILAVRGNGFGNEINWEELSTGETGIKTILHSTQAIYFGSEKGIFLSKDNGASWKIVLLTKGQNKAVNFLTTDEHKPNSLYAACGNGLFYSVNQGENWQRIFKGKNYPENECTVVAANSNQIYLGTKNGLFISQDQGQSWHRVNSKLGNDPILAIAQDTNNPGYVYVASTTGVFKSIDQGQSWERIFVAGTGENNANDEEINDDQDEEVASSDIRYIILDSPHNSLYLATTRGIYKSINQGLNWNSLPNYGLLSRNIKFLFISSDGILYAVTNKGIFSYGEERWHEYSQGISSRGCNFLSVDKQGNFYVATDQGLFKGMITVVQNKIITAYYQDDPEIKMVQQAAIKYAEVEPEKIIQWRKQAAKKAFLPKLSASVNQNTSDLWHWETGSSTKTGDDTLVQGKPSVEWDFTVSWDLSEIIWSSEQTAIDTRSRLRVQLRDDILDEVTKTYFERIRVKMDLDNLSIEDRKKRCEKELRLQELTASLDGLTGGYFSAQLKN